MKTKYFQRTILLLVLCQGLLFSQQVKIETVRDRFGKEVVVERNVVSKSIYRISGIGLNVKDYGISVDQLTLPIVSILVSQIISDYSDIMGLPAENFKLQDVISRSGKWYVYCYQIFADIPVFGSDLCFVIEKHGNILE